MTDRYSRQILFNPIGEAGQHQLGGARVLLVGCGALGSVIADSLVRAGVGFLRIVDRDYVELNNLQRQVLFDEADVQDCLPKAVAAQQKLGRINSAVTVEAVVDDCNAGNAAALASQCNLILDGTDNFDTRYLINDLAIRESIPWIYGACVSATGLVMPVLPGDTPCLQCLFEKAPPPGMSPTCDTAGVLGPTVGVVASLQACEALKILSGNSAAVTRKLVQIDLWSGRIVSLNVGTAPADTCACCGSRRFDYLEGNAGQQATTLCGRNAVQINLPASKAVDLDHLAKSLQNVTSTPVRVNAFMLQAEIDDHHITVFASGRAIIKGTSRIDEARAIYARYVGA